MRNPFKPLMAALHRLARFGLRAAPEPRPTLVYECRACGTRSHRIAPCTYCGVVMKSVEEKKE